MVKNSTSTARLVKSRENSILIIHSLEYIFYLFILPVYFSVLSCAHLIINPLVFHYCYYTVYDILIFANVIKFYKLINSTLMTIEKVSS